MQFTPDTPQELIFEHLTGREEAMLYVGTGIGKTAACLHALNFLFRDLAVTGVLVVAPLRVANLTWPMEIQQWDEFKWMKVANLRTRPGKRAFLENSAHVYLINYDSINTLVKLLEVNGLFGALPFDCVIFDEITKAKNPGSKRINLYRKKVPAVPRNWGLTGTPAPNSLLDLFAPIRLIDGGKRLGESYSHYRHTYFKSTDYMGYTWKDKVGAQKTIEEKISDMTLTLKSSDWLDLPDAVIEDVEIKFTHELQKKYDDFADELILEIHEEAEITACNSAVLINKLLQFTSGAIYDEERNIHVMHSLKLDALKKLIAEASGPVLVACDFLHEQQRIRAAIPQARFFADATGIRAQQTLLDSWNMGLVPVLVAHPASVGHGLNLQHGGNTLVWFSLTFKRELYEQMIARLARRGQKDVVRVYRLMVPGTVDDVVAEALQMKADTETRLLAALAMLESFRKNNVK